MKCSICRRRVGGKPWTMDRSSGILMPQHLACRRVLRETVAPAVPAITASADPTVEARTIRALVALVRLAAKRITP